MGFFFREIESLLKEGIGSVFLAQPFNILLFLSSFARLKAWLGPSKSCI